MSITRAITLSIQPADGITADELWRAMHKSWNAVQRAANAAMRAYFVGDDAATSTSDKGKTKLAKLDGDVSNRAYHAAREASPELPSGCVSDVCQRVRGRYIADRWDVRVAARKSVPTFARPLPLSIRRQDWHLLTGTDEQGRAVYLARFPLLDMLRNDRPTVRFVIRTPRDAKLLAKIAGGEYPRATLEILPPGWERRGAMRAKIVYAKPEVEARVGGTMSVWTGSPSLINCSLDADSRPFCWNLRWLRARMVAYDRARQMRSEDRKFERRMPARRRFVANREGGRAAAKHKDRTATEIQRIASELVSRAMRMGCVKIEYDDSDRSWFEHFPWHQLKGSIEQAAQVRGITFSSSNGSPVGLGRCSADESGGQPCAETADTKPCPQSDGRKGGAM